MNRTLKFRVWDTKNKKFIDAIPPREYMLDSDDWNSGDCERDGDPQYYINHILSETFDDRLGIQQYTGLKDKRGKKIYEGDIVEWKNNFTGEICWSEEEVAFVLRSYTGGYSSINKTYKDRFKVIGNIFENEDLLKV